SGLDSSFGFVMRLADLHYLTKGGSFILCIAKAFWNHRHCRWFSLYKNSLEQCCVPGCISWHIMTLLKNGVNVV
ncbi:MAG: hypothetical protein IKC09_03270, partial [Oscillospiraceae bacterium]|nr:hypothetical protein [Oscillospiraceae bacterium]